MLKKILVSLVLLLAPMGAFAQSSPNFAPNQKVLAPEWNSEFSSKADVNNGSLSNPSITGGHIDNTPVGGTTPGAGSFSALTALSSLLAPKLSATLSAAGNIGYNTSTGRFDFGVGGGVVNHVRLSGDTMTGALHMGANLLDGSNVSFTGGTLSGLTLSGTFTGTPTINTNIAYTTGAFSAGLTLLGNLSGTPPTTGNTGFFNITVPSDTVAAAGTPNGYFGALLNLNLAGGAMSGSQTGMLINLSTTGAIANGNGAFYDGLNVWLTASQAVTGGGNMVALNPQVNVTAGGTGYNLIELMEGVASASAPITGRVGVQIFSGGTTQGSSYDFAYGITGTGTNAAGFKVGLQLGKPGQPWGLDTGGSAISAPTASTTMQLAHGIDLHNVTFTTDSWNDGKFQLTGAGELIGSKITDPASAPGAGKFKLTMEAGTNAGSCKLVARAGTSATAVTVIDNVGSGC